jgi:hypothetical protein
LRTTNVRGEWQDLNMAVSLPQRVINFLRSPEVGRIRFTFPEGSVTMKVDRAMYGRVAKAIEDHRIGVFPARPLYLGGPASTGGKHDNNG